MFQVLPLTSHKEEEEGSNFKPYQCKIFPFSPYTVYSLFNPLAMGAMAPHPFRPRGGLGMPRNKILVC